HHTYTKKEKMSKPTGQVLSFAQNTRPDPNLLELFNNKVVMFNKLVGENYLLEKKIEPTRQKAKELLERGAELEELIKKYNSPSQKELRLQKMINELEELVKITCGSGYFLQSDLVKLY
ncbi:MAG: hypothetical protein QMC38_11785, partial [Sinobacterium sp.]